MGTLAKLKMIPSCSTCGSTSLTLAKDSTAYSRCSFDWETQKWVADFSNTEHPVAADAVRFFCADCGSRHEIPEELT